MEFLGARADFMRIGCSWRKRGNVVGFLFFARGGEGGAWARNHRPVESPTLDVLLDCCSSPETI